MKYNYTPELKRVLDALKEVRKSQTYRNLCDSGRDKAEKTTIRNAYLLSLKVDLLNLHTALEDWLISGGRMES